MAGSLREQLLRAGMASKQQADAALHEVRRAERAAQGNLRSKREQERLDAERLAREVADREAQLAARRQASRAREEAQLQVVRCRQVLRAHALKWRPGPQRFHHRSPDGRFAWRLWLPERLADDLRLGRLALAWVDDGTPGVVVVDAATAERVEAWRPELILFRNRPPLELDASQQLNIDDGTTSGSRPSPAIALSSTDVSPRARL